MIGLATAQGQEALDAPALGGLGRVRQRAGVAIAHVQPRSLRTRAISSSATLRVFSWLPVSEAEVR